MVYKTQQVGPLAAFSLTTIAIAGYIILMQHWFLSFDISISIGQFLSIGILILFSAIFYLSIVHDNSPTKLVVRLRALAATILAPAIAWMLYLSFGIVLLGWQM